MSLLDDADATRNLNDLDKTELYDLIVDFIKSEKLRALEDEGMAQLLFLDGLISDLLSSGAPGDDLTTPPTQDVSASKDSDEKTKSKRNKKNIGKYLAIAGTAVLGGVGAVALAPVVLGAVGFTSAGIAAGSLAASMMSAAAVANGGAVAAGSLVAVLQSAGAVGLSVTASAAVASVGAGVGAGVGATAGLLAGRKKGGEEVEKKNETKFKGEEEVRGQKKEKRRRDNDDDNGDDDNNGDDGEE